MNRPALLYGAVIGVGILAVLIVTSLAWTWVITPAYRSSRPWLVPAGIVATIAIVVGTGVVVARRRHELRQEGWLGSSRPPDRP